MEIIGFHSESELIDLLQENKINHLDFVTHLTPELYDEFMNFCSDQEIEKDESAAILFLEERQRIFNEAFETSDV